MAGFGAYAASRSNGSLHGRLFVVHPMSVPPSIRAVRDENCVFRLAAPIGKERWWVSQGHSQPPHNDASCGLVVAVLDAYAARPRATECAGLTRQIVICGQKLLPLGMIEVNREGRRRYVLDLIVLLRRDSKVGKGTFRRQ